ncbi:MAG: glutathione peroxidase [Thioalkalivibrionaceae bacterium]
MSQFYDLTATAIDGERVSFARYRGQVVLVVNTASQCGFTPHYAGLEQLYQRFRSRGFCVLAFPCNQFGRQEPGDACDISALARDRFDVSFPLFDKVAVNGPDAHPLFQWLKREKAGVLGSRRLKWNFTKFLIGRDGRVIARFAPMTKPERLAPAIEAALGAEPPGSTER